MGWIRNRRKVLIATLTVLGVSVAMLVPLPLSLPGGTARTIDIHARAFAYDPGTVQVHRGDTVTIALDSSDAVHGLAIDGYDVNLQAEPGQSAQVTFVANREGTFKFRCSVTCGALHPFMIGELQVTPDLPLARALIAAGIATLGALFYFWK
ncbi:MAG: hypothetical protein WCF84_19380 [Anaerolineae bacterium]